MDCRFQTMHIAFPLSDKERLSLRKTLEILAHFVLSLILFRNHMDLLIVLAHICVRTEIYVE